MFVELQSSISHHKPTTFPVSCRRMWTLVAHGYWPETQRCACLIFNIEKRNTYWQCACKVFSPLRSGMEQNHTKHRHFNTPETFVSLKKVNPSLCCCHIFGEHWRLLRVPLQVWKSQDKLLERCSLCSSWGQDCISHYTWNLNSSCQWIWANPNFTHLCKQAILPPQRVSLMLSCSRVELILMIGANDKVQRCAHLLGGLMVATRADSQSPPAGWITFGNVSQHDDSNCNLHWWIHSRRTKTHAVLSHIHSYGFQDFIGQ